MPSSVLYLQANPPRPPPSHPINPINNETTHPNNLFPRLNRQLPPNPPSRKPNLLLLIHRHARIIQIQQMRIHPLRPRVLRYLFRFLDPLCSRFCIRIIRGSSSSSCCCCCCCGGGHTPAEKFSETVMQRCCACRAEVAPRVFAEEGAVGGAGLRGHWHFECSFFGLFWRGRWYGRVSGGWLLWWWFCLSG